MYNFRDVNEASGGVMLPSEALQINGEYIENLIPGYRTLTVSGREGLAPELSTYETGTKDGSRLHSKRYPARIITVKYQLIAESSEEFRDAFNKLAQILDVENAELIFRDEEDKFFKGTPSGIGEVEPGRNAIVGSFEITCLDPFKYSVIEYEAQREADGSFLIEYNGTYKSFPTLHAEFFSENEASADGQSVKVLTGAGDCGFVAFFNEEEKIIQVGDPAEVDGDNFAMSQTLINNTFNNMRGWGDAAKSQWPRNTACTTAHNPALNGEMGIYVVNNGSVFFLCPTNYGSGEGWHGVSMSRAIPADAAGETGAVNGTLSFAQHFSIGYGAACIQQVGYFHASLVSGNGSQRAHIASIELRKPSVASVAELVFYVNNKVVFSTFVNVSVSNTLFTKNRTALITKTGRNIRFCIAGIDKTFTDESIAGTRIAEVQFIFAVFGNKPAMTNNGIYWAKFVKNNCTTFKDIPNKFSANDVVTANCGSGEILLNGVSTPSLGALGNDWESFYLKPGFNQIGVSYSDWVQEGYAPTFKIRYREVFL